MRVYILCDDYGPVSVHRSGDTAEIAMRAYRVKFPGYNGALYCIFKNVED